MTSSHAGEAWGGVGGWKNMITSSVNTRIEIAAPAVDVWKVLVDFPSYHEWNPMIREASGDVRVGARLRLHFNPAGTGGRIFRPRLAVVEPGKELAWHGRPGFPGVLQSGHMFILEDPGEGATLLRHDMVFTGFLAGIAVRRTGNFIRYSFGLMNAALKRRVEEGRGGR